MDGRELLKFMAQQAKERLRGKNRFKNGTFVNNNTEIKTISFENKDEKLNLKMKSLIESESICPIKELMDISYYKTLTKEQKERYFFTIADKFRNYKTKLENEKISQVF